MQNRSYGNLLTYAEMYSKYEELARASDNPYFYKLQHKQQYIYCVGVKHTCNPNDGQFAALKKLFSEFKSKVESSNALILIEGGVCPRSSSEQKAITQFGEPGFLVFLADKNALEVVSPEPNDAFILDELKKQFNTESILYSRFTDIACQWNRLPAKPEFRRYVDKFLRSDKIALGLRAQDFPLEKLIEIHDKTHDHKFDKDDLKCFHNDSSPHDNKIVQVAEDIRDNYILNRVVDYIKAGRSLFIVYGSSHVIRYEKFLKQFTS